MSSTARRLYRHPLSGHSHRVQLMLSLLGLEADLIEVDIGAGAHKSAEFLALNPMGQLPVLDDAGEVVADSNGILVYLATRYDASARWLPRDPRDAARVQRWLSLAAGELAFGPAAARLVNVFGLPLDKAHAQAIAGRLLPILEKALAARSFLVGDGATIADVALYTYTAHAPEGDVSLDAYPAIRTWIARIEALPGFVPMQRTLRQAA